MSVAFCTTALASDIAYYQPSPITLSQTAVRVLDGDSIILDGEEWRLLGLDAPGIASARCEGERRTGVLALRRLEALIASGLPIVLHPAGRHDQYNRPLATLMIGTENVSDILVREGYARRYNGGWRKGWCTQATIDAPTPASSSPTTTSNSPPRH